MIIRQTMLLPINCEEVASFPKGILSGSSFEIVRSIEDLKVLENPRLRQWMRHSNFIIFGVGGSCLGGKTIGEISGRSNVRFIDGLDPSTLKRVFSDINLEETGFLCISKSGETMETIYQTFLVLSMIENVLKRDKVVLITEGKASSMREIAETYNFLCLDHPKDVGGRFSVFSIVGMLPAMLCGIDPLKIRAGGVEVLDNHLAEAEKGAAFVAENIRSRLFQHVSFIYSDKLATFGAWLSQLYAESTGKSGTGVTPIVARGSMDQHSQLQLYLDGTNDKCFTFFLEEQEADFQLDSKTAFPAHLAYLKNKTAMDVFRAQHDATIAALLEKKRPIRKIEIPQITPEVLGALFMYFMVEVVYICHMIGVNAFDQPAVERGKNITKALLKRYRDHKIR